MQKVLYSVNFDGYEPIREPLIQTPGWKYILFTNQDYESEYFDIIKVDTDLTGHLAARDFLVNSQKYLSDYDITFFIGGQIQVNCDLDKFIESKCKDTDINLLNHGRQCIYTEAVENKKFHNAEGIKKIDFQMNTYRKEGMPKDFGLYATGLIIRKPSDRLAEFERLWWNEVDNKQYVYRDQLSLTYIQWKYNLVTIHGFGEYWNILHNDFIIYKHGTFQKL